MKLKKIKMNWIKREIKRIYDFSFHWYNDDDLQIRLNNLYKLKDKIK